MLRFSFCICRESFLGLHFFSVIHPAYDKLDHLTWRNTVATKTHKYFSLLSLSRCQSWMALKAFPLVTTNTTSVSGFGKISNIQTYEGQISFSAKVHQNLCSKLCIVVPTEGGWCPLTPIKSVKYNPSQVAACCTVSASWISWLFSTWSLHIFATDTKKLAIQASCQSLFW